MTDPLPCLLKCREKLAGLSKTRQKNIILIFVFILAVAAGLFFQYAFEAPALAQKNNKGGALSLEILDPLNKIGIGMKTASDAAGEISCVGQASIKKDSVAGKIRPKNVAKAKSILGAGVVNPLDKIAKEIAEGKELKNNPKISAMLAGSPMEAMVSALNKKNGKVASYLIAIAKKESDWGRHTPKKNGKECYNYWGYRGKENPTDSGYSCFDSPSHAVEVVGNRIEKLMDSNVNTPAKMVVWKCGSNCEAAGGQAAANKWVADVAAYYNKLQG